MNKKRAIKIAKISLFIIIYLYFTIFIFIPFMQHNNLYAWDGSGHISAIKYFQENCFPKFVCWNQHYFLGYPQGQFYPQGTYWIATGISSLFNLDLIYSLKILLMISLFLYPLSVYYLLKKLIKDEVLRVLLLLISILIYFISADFYGGNIVSLLNTGLITHFFTMPIFFFYLGSLIGLYKKEKQILKVSILLSIIILCHIVIAALSLISLMSLLIYIAIEQKKTIRRNLIKTAQHLALTASMTAFWTIPFLAKLDYLSAVKTSTANSQLVFLYPIIGIITIFYFLKKEKQYLFFPIFFTIFTIIYLIGEKTNLIPFHFYRLYPILLLFGAYSLSVYLYSLKNILAKIILFLFTITLIYFSLVNISDLNTKGVYEQELPKIEDMSNSRYFISVPIGTESSPHYIQTMLPYESNLKSVKGLFVEGSKNSKYILVTDFLKSPENLVWSIDIPAEFAFSVLDPNFIKKAYKIFGVSKVIETANPNFEINPSKVKINYFKEKDEPYFRNFNYKIKNVEPNEIIHPLTYIPKQINGSVDEWFFSPFTQEFESIEKVPLINFETNATIKNVNIAKDHISFEINKLSPVILKISHYPNWKAYETNEEESKREAKIYEMAPSIMLVIGQGKIELNYETLWYEKIAYLISAITIISLILLWFYQTFKKLDLIKKTWIVEEK